MKQYRDKNYTKYAVLVIGAAIIIRIILALLTHNAGDGCWHLSSARFTAVHGEFPLFQELGRDFEPFHLSEPFWPPPVFHMIAALFYAIFSLINTSAAELGMNLVSPLFGGLSLILIFFITKKLYNQKIAFYATLFLSVIPMHLYLSSIAHIDALLTFFVLLSILFMLYNKVLASSIFAGIAILTKYNGLFVVPVLLTIIYFNNNKNKVIKKSLLTAVISLAIGSIWLIRNWILLKNPFFPFLGFIFGEQNLSFSIPSVFHLFNPSHYSKTYLSLFGVPLGDLSSFFFFPIPYITFLLIAWGFATLLFFIPIVIGLAKLKLRDKSTKILTIWILSFVLLSIIYITTQGVFFPRFLLPLIPALGIMWALGITSLQKRKTVSLFITILLLFLIIGFVSGEFLKVGIIRNAWNNLNDDFNWVRENTPKQALFYFQEQCLTYNIDRPTTWSIKKVEQREGYIWTQAPESSTGRSLLPNNFPQDITENYVLLYENPSTTTKIYKIT